MITLTWQQYADWLQSTQGMSKQEAIDTSRKLFFKQYGRWPEQTNYCNNSYFEPKEPHPCH